MHFQVESDYNATLLFKLPNYQTPLNYFLGLFDGVNGELLDKWAMQTPIAPMRLAEIDELIPAFDRSQVDDHLSDSATIKSHMTANLNSVDQLFVIDS